jgi:hypothetical protein
LKERLGPKCTCIQLGLDGFRDAWFSDLDETARLTGVIPNEAVLEIKNVDG